MRKTFLHLALGSLLAIVLAGCGHSEEDQGETDTYTEAREAAWNYLDEKGWNDTAQEDWQSAEVKTVKVGGDNYELLDSSYEGEEVLAVIFEEKEAVMLAPPSVLVDSDTNEVIGYMPSE